MTRKKNLILAAYFVLVATLAGCGKPEIYGEMTPGRSVTEVKNILMRPASYSEKSVTVQGKITSECPTGCWFNIKDGEAVIYVDLTPSGIAIPQSVGRTVVIDGEVAIKEGKPEITGKGVRIK